MHWYVLSESTGVATLCASESDARREAGAYDRLYPRAAPHVATRLAAIDASDGDKCTKCSVAQEHQLFVTSVRALLSIHDANSVRVEELLLANNVVKLHLTEGAQAELDALERVRTLCSAQPRN